MLFPQLIKWQKLEWLTDGARGIDDLQYDEILTWPILGELTGPGVSGSLDVLARRHRRRSIVPRLSRIVKSRVGRSLIAIRDNETAAAVMGVNRPRTQTIVFGVSAAITATAGALFGIRLNGSQP